MNQYKQDFFHKMHMAFVPGKTLLDVGCGDGTDAVIFAKRYKLKVCGVDVYKHPNFAKLKKIRFKKASVYDLPFKSKIFDYIFLHDVLHHVDEPNQRKSFHLKALTEIKRVCKKNGQIIIAEGNRYNPLFYPHMVLIKKHQHFTQKYFCEIIDSLFANKNYIFFEAHLYPPTWITIFKIYEWLMEHLIPRQFRAYNVAVINNV